MEIAFDIHEDSFSGLEWRMFLIRDGKKPHLLARSWRNFKHMYEVEAEIEGISRTLKAQSEIRIIQFEAPIHPITESKQKPPRADVFG